MLIINSAKVYISSANVDMRKSIDGLSSIVEQKKLSLVPCRTPYLYSTTATAIKSKCCIVTEDGFYLLYKCMEYGKFHFPPKITENKYTVTSEELNWLLHGLQVENIRKYEKLKKERLSTEKDTFQHGIMQ